MRGKVGGALVASALLVMSWTSIGAALTPTRAVGVVTETFVDHQRPTAANGDCPKLPSRTLPTMIFYPASATASGTASATAPSSAAQTNAAPDTSAGPYPLIVFAHGFAATARSYQPLLEYLASR